MRNKLVDIFKDKKILIVDDNEKTIQLIGDYLRSNGDFITSVAKNGREAIDRAEKNRPDLIIMDINMPIMDGLQVCDKLKSKESLKNVPVIFITAQDSIEDKVKALDGKGNDFITKPFYEEELILRLKLHLTYEESRRKMITYFEELNLLLQNTNRPIFCINEKGIILSPMSKESEKLLGINCEGQSIIKTLYKDLDSKKLEETIALIESISNIKKDDWEKIQGKFPTKISYKDKNENSLILDILYNPIWAFDDSILKIQLILN
ncbi:MAG: hypothetical protein CME68_04135 [Halobacteriovoraceae bacterium]|nr:hypothetical protein [Halobacteriovoraceae bacterium]|tara:strand:+ start:171 stop:962 length:792 start_codon:yes stop_codon:yes gene_type:complete